MYLIPSSMSFMRRFVLAIRTQKAEKVCTIFYFASTVFILVRILFIIESLKFISDQNKHRSVESFRSFRKHRCNFVIFQIYLSDEWEMRDECGKLCTSEPSPLCLCICSCVCCVYVCANSTFDWAVVNWDDINTWSSVLMLTTNFASYSLQSFFNMNLFFCYCHCSTVLI